MSIKSSKNSSNSAVSAKISAISALAKVSDMPINKKLTMEYIRLHGFIPKYPGNEGIIYITCPSYKEDSKTIETHTGINLRKAKVLQKDMANNLNFWAFDIQTDVN